MKKTIKSVLIGALVALLGSSSWAAEIDCGEVIISHDQTLILTNDQNEAILWGDVKSSSSSNEDIARLVSSNDTVNTYAAVNNPMRDGTAKLVVTTAENNYNFTVRAMTVEIEKTIKAMADTDPNDRSNAIIRVTTHVLYGVHEIPTNTILFIGSACTSHGLGGSGKDKTIARDNTAGQINTVAQKGNVRWYLFNNGSGKQSSTTAADSGTVEMGKTVKDISTSLYNGGQHRNLLAYLKCLDDNLKDDHSGVDYIVLSFDGGRLAREYPVGQTELEARVAKKLEWYYANKRVIWIREGYPVTWDEDPNEQYGDEYYRPSNTNDSGIMDQATWEAMVALFDPDTYNNNETGKRYTNTKTGTGEMSGETIYAATRNDIQTDYNNPDQVKAFLDENIKVATYDTRLTDKVLNLGNSLSIVKTGEKGSEKQEVHFYTWAGDEAPENYLDEDHPTIADLEKGDKMWKAESESAFKINGYEVAANVSNITMETWNMFEISIVDNGTFLQECIKAGLAEYDEETGKYRVNPNDGSAHVTLYATEGGKEMEVQSTSKATSVLWPMDNPQMFIRLKDASKPYDGIATNVDLIAVTNAAGKEVTTTQIEYSTSETGPWTAWSTAAFANVTDGPKKVYVRAEATGYSAATNFAYVTITPATITPVKPGEKLPEDGSPYTYAPPISYTYDGTATNIVPVTENLFPGNGPQYLYVLATDRDSDVPPADGWVTPGDFKKIKDVVLDGGKVTSNKVWYTVTTKTAGDVENYFAATNFAWVTITPRPVTLTAASENWPYDGDEHKTNEYSVAVGTSFVNGEGLKSDKFAAMTAASVITNVGQVANVIDKDALEAKDGTKLDNYDIKLVPGRLMVSRVDLKPSQVWAEDAEKVYNGGDVAGNYKTNIVVKFGEGMDASKFVVEYAADSKAVPDEKRTAGFTMVHPDDAPPDSEFSADFKGYQDSCENKVWFRVRESEPYSGDEKGNYSNYYGYAWVKIAPRPVHFSFPKAVKPYDGNTTYEQGLSTNLVKATHGESVQGKDHGMVGSEKFNCTATGSFTSANVKDDENYFQLTDVTITGERNAFKRNYVITYDGEDDSLVPGEITAAPLPVYTPTEANPLPPEGGAPCVYATNVVVYYDGNGASIEAKAYNLCAKEDYVTFLYSTNNAAEPWVKSLSVTNVVMNGDAVGRYTVWYKVDEAPNYMKDAVGSATITILPRPVTVKAGDAEWPYDGVTHSTNSFEVLSAAAAECPEGLVPYYGFILKEGVESVLTTGEITTVDESPVPNVIESVDDITFSNGTLRVNYDITLSNGVLKVGNAKLDVTAVSVTECYDTTTHRLASYTVTDRKSGESVAPKAISNSTDGVTWYLRDQFPLYVNVTNEAPVWVAVVADNYDTFVSQGSLATVTVTQRVLTVTLNDTNKVYGAAIPEWTVKNVEGIVGTDTRTGEPGKIIGDVPTEVSGSPHTVAVDKGTLSVSDGNGGKNYLVVVKDPKLRITPAPIDPDKVDYEGEYDGVPHSATFEFTPGAAVAAGDVMTTNFWTGPIGTPADSGVWTAVGTENWEQTDVTNMSVKAEIRCPNGNFIATNIVADIVIWPRVIDDDPSQGRTAVRANDTSMVYGADVPDPTYRGGEGILDAHCLDVRLCYTNDPVYMVREYPDAITTNALIAVTNAAGVDVTANYAIRFYPGTLTVEAAGLAVTAESVTNCYDTTTHRLASYTVTDRKSGESVTPKAISNSTDGVTWYLKEDFPYYIDVTENAPVWVAVVADNFDTFVSKGPLATVTVTQKVLTVTLNDTNKVYGVTTPAWTVKNVEGLVGNDRLTGAPGKVVGTEPTDVTGSPHTVTVDNGTLKVNDGNDGNNYKVVLRQPKLTITPARMWIGEEEPGVEQPEDPGKPLTPPAPRTSPDDPIDASSGVASVFMWHEEGVYTNIIVKVQTPAEGCTLRFRGDEDGVWTDAADFEGYTMPTNSAKVWYAVTDPAGNYVAVTNYAWVTIVERAADVDAGKGLANAAELESTLEENAYKYKTEDYEYVKLRVTVKAREEIPSEQAVGSKIRTTKEEFEPQAEAIIFAASLKANVSSDAIKADLHDFVLERTYDKAAGDALAEHGTYNKADWTDIGANGENEDLYEFKLDYNKPNGYDLVGIAKYHGNDVRWLAQGNKSPDCYRIATENGKQVLTFWLEEFCAVGSCFTPHATPVEPCHGICCWEEEATGCRAYDFKASLKTVDGRQGTSRTKDMCLGSVSAVAYYRVKASRTVKGVFTDCDQCQIATGVKRESLLVGEAGGGAMFYVATSAQKYRDIYSATYFAAPDLNNPTPGDAYKFHILNYIGGPAFGSSKVAEALLGIDFVERDQYNEYRNYSLLCAGFGSRGDNLVKNLSGKLSGAVTSASWCGQATQCYEPCTQAAYVSGGGQNVWQGISPASPAYDTVSGSWSLKYNASKSRLPTWDRLIQKTFGSAATLMTGNPPPTFPFDFVGIGL